MADTRQIQKILKERTTSPQVITLDGGAGTGKTSLARSLASLLGFNYLDTGAMYRSIALRLGEESWLRSGPWLEEQLAVLRFSLKGSGEETLLVLDGYPVSEEIRREEVGMWASKLAQLTVVREHLTLFQQELGNNFSLVAEGRDMGTVVFPEAQFKYFLFADSEERARRRQRQIRDEYGKKAELSEIRQDLKKRDRQDSDRSLAPLRAAEDAISIDTTDKDFSQVLHLILEDMQSHLGAIQDPTHDSGGLSL